MDLAVGHNGRRAWFLGSFTLAFFSLGWLRSVRPELCRLFFVFERVVDSFGASRCGVAGLPRLWSPLICQTKKRKSAPS